MSRTDDTSVIVGATRLAKITGKSLTWARNLLKSWHLEQQRGGPERVFVREHGQGGRAAVYTTLAIVQRELVGSVRDPVLFRKIEEHDRSLDSMARRIDKLTSEIVSLRQQIARKAS